MFRGFLLCFALLGIFSTQGYSEVFVNNTKWSVEDAGNGKNGDYHPVPWVFSRNGTVHAGDLWRGVWQRKSNDTISVVIMHNNTAADEFDVQFTGPSSFTAFKNGRVYRYAIRKSGIYVNNSTWSVEGAENGKNGDYHPVPWVFSRNGTVHAGDLWRGVWQRKSSDTISVAIMHNNTVTDEFDVQFTGPSSFTAFKNGRVYRYAIRKSGIYVNNSTWSVEDAGNGKNGDYHPVPWVFSHNGTVHAGNLWRGVWQRKSSDTISVAIMHNNTAVGEFDVKFINQTEFIAFKQGKEYRYGLRK